MKFGNMQWIPNARRNMRQTFIFHFLRGGRGGLYTGVNEELPDWIPSHFHENNLLKKLKYKHSQLYIYAKKVLRLSTMITGCSPL